MLDNRFIESVNKQVNMNKLKLIGKGLFSRVYDKGDGSVLIYSKDHAKECLSMQWHDNSMGLFPEVDRIDYLDNGQFIYQCKKYTKVRSLKNTLDADQYTLYLELRALFSSLCYPHNRNDNYHYLYDTFNSSTLDEDVRYSILDFLDALCNFGTDMYFEISPRNVAVDKGKLVLLDCFFFGSQAIKARSKTL